MSRKPATGTKHHDASAPNCQLRQVAALLEPLRPGRVCLKCAMGGRRRAVRLR